MNRKIFFQLFKDLSRGAGWLITGGIACVTAFYLVTGMIKLLRAPASVIARYAQSLDVWDYERASIALLCSIGAACFMRSLWLRAAAKVDADKEVN